MEYVLEDFEIYCGKKRLLITKIEFSVDPCFEDLTFDAHDELGRLNKYGKSKAITEYSFQYADVFTNESDPNEYFSANEDLFRLIVPKQSVIELLEKNYNDT